MTKEELLHFLRENLRIGVRVDYDSYSNYSDDKKIRVEVRLMLGDDEVISSDTDSITL